MSFLCRTKFWTFESHMMSRSPPQLELCYCSKTSSPGSMLYTLRRSRRRIVCYRSFSTKTAKLFCDTKLTQVGSSPVRAALSNAAFPVTTYKCLFCLLTLILQPRIRTGTVVENIHRPCRELLAAQPYAMSYQSSQNYMPDTAIGHSL